MTALQPESARNVAMGPAGEREELAPTAAVPRTVSEPDRPLWMQVYRAGARVVMLAVSGAVDSAGQPRLAEVLRQRLEGLAAMLVLVPSPAVDRLTSLLEVTDQFVCASPVAQALTLPEDLSRLAIRYGGVLAWGSTGPITGQSA